MPETPAGPQPRDPGVPGPPPPLPVGAGTSRPSAASGGEDEDVADLAALALVASGRAGQAERDDALTRAGDILLRRPDLEAEWRDLRQTSAQLGALIGPAAPHAAPGEEEAFPGVPAAAARPSVGRALATRRGPALGRLAAAAAVLVAAGAGYSVGDRSPGATRAEPVISTTAGTPTAGSAGPTVVLTVASASADAPGALVRSAADPGTGARLTVRVVPAAGWVRLEATVSGVAAGRRCRLVAVPRSGAPVLAGSWLVSPKGAGEGTGLMGTALVAPADLASVRVEDDAGTVLVATVI